jgi:hypothetical protein
MPIKIKESKAINYFLNYNKSYKRMPKVVNIKNKSLVLVLVLVY